MSKFKVENKFSVGNKVVPVTTIENGGQSIYEDHIYTVMNVRACGSIDIFGNFKCFPNAWGLNWPEEWFKLAEEKEMEQTAEQIRNEILRIDTRVEEAKKDIENAENERNSLVEKLREKGFVMTEVITSPERFEVGDYVKVVRNTKFHQFLVGTEVVILSVYDLGYGCQDFSGNTFWCRDTDVEKI